MRKLGNVCDYTEERNHELLVKFKKMVREAPVIDIDSIFRKLSRTPASRFYVSEGRAYAMIRRYRKTGKWGVTSELRVEMFEEIERRVRRIEERGEADNLEDAVYMAVNSEAPRFYLTTRSVRTLLYSLVNCRKRW